MYVVSVKSHDLQYRPTLFIVKAALFVWYWTVSPSVLNWNRLTGRLQYRVVVITVFFVVVPAKNDVSHRRNNTVTLVMLNNKKVVIHVTYTRCGHWTVNSHSIYWGPMTLTLSVAASSRTLKTFCRTSAVLLTV